MCDCFAIAKVSGKDISQVRGEIRFYQKNGFVLVEAAVSGLPKNNGTRFFALHIHEGENCDGPEFSETGKHFNPTGTSHPNHLGDLPPLLSKNDGKAYLLVQTDRFRVRDIIGRTVVIHSKADDFVSQPSGNSGEKIACGVISRI